MASLARLFVCLLAASSSLLYAADCASLRSLHLPDTDITLAEPVTTGTLELPDTGAPLRDLPAFCRVTGEIHPTADSRIGFEVWLPTDGPSQKWNGRLLGVGNGGFAGSFSRRDMAGYLKRGFAVSATDAGHQAAATDASWAYGHPEKVKDFGWRAIHLTAERAKQILDAYYGKSADKSYFDACSDGGREALMEAQRFPDDYDGILAGAPANTWSSLVTGGAAAMQTLLNDPRAWIPPRKLPALQRASLAACDDLDGVQDGVVGDPAKCRFDPQVLLCKGEDSDDCLTQPQINAVKSLYRGARDSHGAPVFPGFTIGDETSWKEWVMGQDPGASAGARYVRNYFRYIASGDPTINVLTTSVDTLLRQSKEKGAPDLDSANPDLSRFAAHGGKLILYHGWNDPAISPLNTVAYVAAVEKKMGEQKTESFLRLYMIPGMEHCFEGPGANAFGQFGLATSAEPKYGLFDSLVNWVEKGSPVENVIATKYAATPDGKPKVLFTRPLCAYPKVARYSGSGDQNDAANFTCTTP